MYACVRARAACFVADTGRRNTNEAFEDSAAHGKTRQAVTYRDRGSCNETELPDSQPGQHGCVQPHTLQDCFLLAAGWPSVRCMD